MFLKITKILFLVVIHIFCIKNVIAQNNFKRDDTIKIGMHINAIRNFDFINKSFYVDMWIFFNFNNIYYDSLTKYKNPIYNYKIRDSIKKEINAYALENLNKIEFVNCVEPNNGGQPILKLIDIDSIEHNVNWICCKISAPFRYNWNLKNYPFDIQKLNIIIESTDPYLRIIPLKDKYNNDNFTYDKEFDDNLNNQITEIKIYKKESADSSNYGNPNIFRTFEYSQLQFEIKIEPLAPILTFFKLSSCLLITFLLTVSTFYVKATNIDARFGLCVGGMFSAIGSKYMVDNIVPANNQNTLFDWIHNTTFVYILIITIISIISLKWMEKENKKTHFASQHLDRFSFWVLLISYFTITGLIVLTAMLPSLDFDQEIKFIIYCTIGCISLGIICYYYFKIKELINIV